MIDLKNIKFNKISPTEEGYYVAKFTKDNHTEIVKIELDMIKQVLVLKSYYGFSVQELFRYQEWEFSERILL